MSAPYVAYCYECNGGGKVIAAGGKRACNIEAASHFRLYGHHTGIIARKEMSK